MSNAKEPGAGGQTAAAHLPDVAFDEFTPLSYEAWKEAATAALKGAPFDKRMFTKTYEGITLNPMYTAEDTGALRAARTYPGSYSLRGNEASGNLKRAWEIVQFCDEALPQEAHRNLLHELERGATSVAFRLDPRTEAGLDADAPGTDGAGVSLSTLEDVEALLKGLLDRPLAIYAGASAAPLLGFVDALAKKEGVAPRMLAGCVGADPMGYLLETGGLPAPLDQLWDEMAETIRWAEATGSPLRTVLIRGSVPHDGGADAAQEAACAMTAAIETLRAMLARGISVEQFARRLRFEFSQGANFFMEIAKLRAARIAWAQIAESFGGGEEARKSQIFARTSRFTRTVYDPYVNMLRGATEAFSAIVGGVEGLTVGCFDEALRPGSEFSRRVARNAQIMLQKEFNLREPIDPAGGSWYLEALTDELSRRVWARLQEIEGRGGFLESVKAGVLQEDVAGTLASRWKNLAKRSDRAVGTNMYPNMSEPLPEFGSPDWEGLREERLRALKGAQGARDDAGVKKALEGLSGDGLIGKVAAAAEAGATLGEVRAALAGGRGDVAAEPVRPHRWTEQFEELRARTEAYRARTGDNFRVFLANMGPIPQHKARADFISSFMEVAAFEMLRNDGFETPEACAEAAAASGAEIAVICSTDATYPEVVPPLARAIKERAPKMGVYLAGEPAPEFKDAYVEAGVEGFISVRSNCLETLSGFQKMKGMF